MATAGALPAWGNRPTYGRPVLEMIDEAFAAGQAAQAIVVCVDGWTRYGGEPVHCDSNGTGRYQSYLCDEIVTYIDDRYRTIPDRDHRAVMGKSSGGFGALAASMLRPDVFGACAEPRRGRLLRSALSAQYAGGRAEPAFLGRRHPGMVDRLPGPVPRRAAQRSQNSSTSWELLPASHPTPKGSRCFPSIPAMLCTSTSSRARTMTRSAAAGCTPFAGWLESSPGPTSDSSREGTPPPERSQHARSPHIRSGILDQAVPRPAQRAR